MSVREFTIAAVSLSLFLAAGPTTAQQPRESLVTQGHALFQAHGCHGCHTVGKVGTPIAPDLSRVGVARSREAIVQRIRRSVEGEFRQGYAPVTLTPHSGPPIQGVKKNEDLFSIQIMDSSERLQGFVKSTVGSVAEEKRTLMPAYTVDQLNDKDLDDLLRYLGTLRGTPAAR